MPKLNEVFELTRVINLVHRTDRLRQMKRQLKTLGCSFIPGNVELYAATRETASNGFPNAGAHGCFVSHLTILRDAKKRGVKNVLIMEDDLEIREEDVPRLELMLEQSKGMEWGFLYPGHVLQLKQTTEPKWLPYGGAIQTTHFYAVNGFALDRLLEYLEGCLQRPPGDPVGGPMHYDGALTMFRAANPDIITLVADPSLGSQRSSRSDISFRNIERIPILRQAMSGARTLTRVAQMARRRMER